MLLVFLCYRIVDHPKTMKLHLLKAGAYTRHWRSFFFLLLFPLFLSAQSLQLSLPSLTVPDGTTVTMPVTVAGF